jgi:hypothetical protein
VSYSTIARCGNDLALNQRVQSAVVQEGHDLRTADVGYQFQLASASDIEAAYASAIAAGNDNPGGDESVITDGMILAYVQANPPEQAAP